MGLNDLARQIDGLLERFETIHHQVVTLSEILNSKYAVDNNKRPKN